jgi:hypothetical protein
MAEAELKALSGVSEGFIDEDTVPGTVRLVDISDSYGGQHHKRDRDIILVPTPSSDEGILTSYFWPPYEKIVNKSDCNLQMIHSIGRHDGNCSRSPV